MEKKILGGFAIGFGVLIFVAILKSQLTKMGALGYVIAVGAILLIALFIILSFILKRNKEKKEVEAIKKENEGLLLSIMEEEQRLEQRRMEEEQHLEQRRKEFGELQNQKEALNSDLESIKKAIKEATAELIVAESLVFENDSITSEEYKDKLAMLRLEYKEFLKTEKAVHCNSNLYYGEKKKRQTDNIKQILRCFNAEASSVVSSVTVSNIEKARGTLTKSFEQINSIFATDGISLDKQLLEFRLKEINIIYSYLKKKELEIEEQKAIKAQMVEEEKVRREIEREKAKLEKEESQFKNEVDKLMKYLSKSSDDVEKQLYIDKIKELEEKLKLLEKDKENVLQREQNTRAGFVYIISNIGSFGENIYKIGMTRRLDPMDRVKELGDASVPFEFDVHAMIFSEDAPSLETILHNTFKNHQVNLVNPRKEFYNVSLDEIEKIVKENYNATVTFTHIAEAAQYRESVKIRETMA